MATWERAGHGTGSVEPKSLPPERGSKLEAEPRELALGSLGEPPREAASA